MFFNQHQDVISKQEVDSVTLLHVAVSTGTGETGCRLSAFFYFAARVKLETEWKQTSAWLGQRSEVSSAGGGARGS